MLSIVSKVESGRLLHVIADAKEPFDGRLNLSESDQWLQVSVLHLSPDRKVGPHIHTPRERTIASSPAITQECWIILNGAVNVRLFDLDRMFLHEQTLVAGNLLVTFQGGHALNGLAGGAVMIECKNGPFLGRDYTTFETA